MSAKVAKSPGVHYQSPDIPLSAIRKFARAIADRFDPEQIILFGSYAYGAPHADSDVDLLVVMPCANEIDQSVRIRWALESPFPLDLIVRTPKRLEQRIADGDWFLRDVTQQGKVLYAKSNKAMGAKGRGRLQGGQRRSGRR